MPCVLLIGKDWSTRALLRAELLEESVDVEAHETVGEAMKALEPAPPFPALLIADLSVSDDPEADADSLAPFARQVPIWVIATRTVTLPKGLKDRGFEMILLKPLDVGELVEQIKLRLKKQ